MLIVNSLSCQHIRLSTLWSVDANCEDFSTVVMKCKLNDVQVIKIMWITNEFPFAGHTVSVYENLVKKKSVWVFSKSIHLSETKPLVKAPIKTPNMNKVEESWIKNSRPQTRLNWNTTIRMQPPIVVELKAFRASQEHFFGTASQYCRTALRWPR